MTKIADGERSFGALTLHRRRLADNDKRPAATTEIYHWRKGRPGA